MKADDGTRIALGAATALALLGAWGSSRGSMAKGKPSEDEIQRGRVVREIKRIAERGPTRGRDEDGRPEQEGVPVSIRQISEETGASMEVVEEEARRLASPGGGRGYYLEGEGESLSIGKVSPTMRWLTERVGKLKDRNPELAIRLVDVVLSYLLASTTSERLSGVISETETLIEDFNEGVGEDIFYRQIEVQPGEELKGYAQLYHYALIDRRMLKTAKDPDLWTDFGEGSFDNLSTNWRGHPYLPWIESIVAEAVQDEDLDKISTLLDRLTHVLDWVDAPGRREAIRERRRAERRRAEAQARRARGQAVEAQEQADDEGEEIDYGPEDLTVGVSLADAIEYADNWQRYAGRRTSKETIKALKAKGMWFGCHDGIHPINSPIVHRHANGWTWRKISTFEEKAYEGNMGSAEGLRSVPTRRTAYGFGCLRHCIGTNHISDYTEENGYFNYSLRTPANRPMLTITISNRQVIDFAGRMNRWPGTLGTYQGGVGVYVMAMLKKEGLDFKNESDYLDAEAQMIEEFFNAMNLSLRSSSRTDSVVSRLSEIERRKKAAAADGSPNRWPRYSRSVSGKLRDPSRRRRKSR